MASLATQQRYLKFSAFLMMSFGPVFFLASMSWATFPATFAMDLLDWPLDGAQNIEDQTTRFLAGVTSGFMMGWGVLVWRLSGAAFEAAPEAVRQAVVTGALVWYVFDSAGSVLAGAGSNMVFNTVFLAVGIGPLWRAASPDASPA